MRVMAVQGDQSLVAGSCRGWISTMLLKQTTAPSANVAPSANAAPVHVRPTVTAAALYARQALNDLDALDLEIRKDPSIAADTTWANHWSTAWNRLKIVGTESNAPGLQPLFDLCYSESWQKGDAPSNECLTQYEEYRGRTEFVQHLIPTETPDPPTRRFWGQGSSGATAVPENATSTP